MKLTIEEKVKETKHTDKFVVEITMMHGDTDHYTKDVVVIPKEKECLVKEVIETLNHMQSLSWNGARETYGTLPGFLAWFGMEFLGKMDDEEKAMDKNWDNAYTYKKWSEINSYSFTWHKDVRDRDDNTRLEKYEVFYFDENNEKFNVKVEK